MKKQVCSGCKRELDFTYQFFPPDKKSKEGLRKKCRECDKKYYGFLDSAESHKRRNWTKEEDALLRENYPHYTNEELQNLFFQDRTIRAVSSRADIIGCTGKSEEVLTKIKEKRGAAASKANKGKKRSPELRLRDSEIKKEYYRIHGTDHLKGREFSEETRKKMSEAKKLANKWKGEDNPRHQNPLRGAENGRWKGGFKPLIKSMRDEIKDWKNMSSAECGYKSVITGKEFTDIHHLIPFRYIFDLALTGLNLEERECQSLYEPNDYEALRKKIIELHETYGLIGMCMEKEVHKLFHDTYGYTQNTPEQFFSFVVDCENGKYTDYFSENGLNIEINNNVISKAYDQYIKLKEVIAA